MTADKIEKRTVKSFVRRSGRMTPAQKAAIAAHWPEFGIDYRREWIEKPDAFRAMKLEVGIGNGNALLAMAENDRDSWYIGIEVHQPGIGRCLLGIRQRGLHNVRLIKHDAVEVLAQMIAPQSFDGVLLFFPDPWPKKRHHKRRIVNAEFRDLLSCALKPGGEIHIATDWQDYAESIAAQFLADKRFTNLGNANGFCTDSKHRPQTHFECRGRKLGHQVWDLIFAKR